VADESGPSDRPADETHDGEAGTESLKPAPGRSQNCPCDRVDARVARESGDRLSPANSSGREGPSFRGDHRARMDRRGLAKVLATIGGLTAVGSLAAPLAGLTRVFERTYQGPIYADGVHLVDADGNRVDENFLTNGQFATVFPETHPTVDDAPTLLVRFPEDAYGGGTELAFTVAGYAAYSKVCTHAGCMVSNREDDIFVCPCHFGKFDPTRGAMVVGGPPPRPLPQLSITLASDGSLIATADFEGPIGPTEG